MRAQQVERPTPWSQMPSNSRAAPTWIDPVSDGMRAVFRLADAAARVPISVLILGETGAGKEIVAQRIHAMSPRGGGPFVAVDVAAIDEGLFASSMFGHERGAFTSAVTDREGWFEAADRGSLFLDEIGDLSLACQAKLLRALQENEIARVGSVSKRRIDVRVLAATNRDLKEMVRKGIFRDDLYYRLSGLPIYVPALRDRRADIPALVMAFTGDCSERFGTPTSQWADDALALLLGHQWPGNVRELKQVVERTVALCASPVIHAEHVLLDAPTPKETDLRSIVRQCERGAIVGALSATNGNISRAARLLSVPLATLQDKCRRLGLR